jgi:hypothetical protein
MVIRHRKIAFVVTAKPSRHLNYQYIFLCVRHGVEVGEGVSLCMCESKTPHSIL